MKTADEQRRYDNDATASQSCGESAGQWHRQDRTDTKAQQKQPEYTIVHNRASLGEWHEGSPCRHPEAGNEEHNPGGNLFKACGGGTSGGGCHGFYYLLG